MQRRFPHAPRLGISSCFAGRGILTCWMSCHPSHTDAMTIRSMHSQVRSQFSLN